MPSLEHAAVVTRGMREQFGIPAAKNEPDQVVSLPTRHSIPIEL